MDYAATVDSPPYFEHMTRFKSGILDVPRWQAPLKALFQFRLPVVPEGIRVPRPAPAFRADGFVIMPPDIRGGHPFRVPRERADTMADKAAKPAITEFIFQHPALRLANSFFSLSLGEPVLQVDLGDARGAIPLRQVAGLFNIDPESPDGQLLGLVASSLRYVRFIRHGDRIPTEIIDGTASWHIDNRHRDMALLKLGGSILKAIMGGRPDSPLTMLEEGEEAKRKVREKAAEIAALAGLPPERKQEVMDHVDLLVNEMAFIEALRDYFKPVFDIGRKLRAIQKQARGDRELDQQLRRMQTLLKTPVTSLSNRFDEVEGATGEAVVALRQFEATLAMLRRHRDDLHAETLLWGDIPARWRDLNPDNPDAIQDVNQLYRFLARNYLDAKVWISG